MSDELIVRDEGDGDAPRVRWIALHRPASKNGLTVEINQRMLAAIDEVARDRSIRAVVLTGEGGAFSSGLDLKAAATLGSAGPEAIEEQMTRWFHGLIRAIRRCDRPVIALVDGPAVGFGCDLALACDLRLGTPRARFGEVFIKRGLMPDGGGTFHLPRLVGLGVALDLLFTGDVVEAEDARRLGLLSRIVPVETARVDTLAFAQRIAAGPPRVHAWIKRAVYGALDGTLDDALAVEAKGQLELLRSRDFMEGVMAFFEKRPPKFTGE
jgi:enoyl-CoA hydratase/carnithine racemase